MKAVVYQEPFKVSVDTVQDPRIEQPNDVLVRVTSTAICGSDLHMYEGRTLAEPGIVFGHENLGTVEEVGSGVTSIRRGDRVVMPFNVACGFCKKCNVKRYNRQLRDLISAGRATPSFVVSHDLPLDQAPMAYEKFDKRIEGFTKVVLHPGT